MTATREVDVKALNKAVGDGHKIYVKAALMTTFMKGWEQVPR